MYKISTSVHPTAIIDTNAELGTDVTIGPHSVIEGNVSIGNNTWIGNHVTVCGHTTIGENCRIFHSSSVGEIPQDLKFSGEETKTLIGDRTIIREFVTVNRGTKALGNTKVGSDCLLMASTHVAHDCQIGNNVIMANLSTLGGHVEIGDWASLGGGVLVHQFCKIGEYAFIGGGFRAVQDIPPYILAAEEPLNYQGINHIGLKRRGFSRKDRKIIKNTYQIFFRSGLNRNKALDIIKQDIEGSQYKERILEFFRLSERGII